MSFTYFVKIAVTGHGLSAGRIFSTPADNVAIDQNGNLELESDTGQKLLLDESKWRSVHITKVDEDIKGTTGSKALR